MNANACTLRGAQLLGAVLAGSRNSQDAAELGRGKLFAIEVHGSKGGWKKNFLRAFKRFVIFGGFTDVRGCFPMAKMFLLFRLMAAAIPSQVFRPH